jgi:iduronate 2-sulfatase
MTIARNTLLFTLSVLCISSSLREVSAAGNLNVLLIMCDDLNDYVETLGGHPQAKTPNIRRLIDSGVSFTQAHSNIPICAPSRASMMTGIYPHNSQQFGFEKWTENEVLANSRTLMDHFRANGYHTLGTGKIMHANDRQEWQDYGNPPDYSPFPNDGRANIAHPDTPSPFRDDFGAVDGSFGPLISLKDRTSPGADRPLRWMGGGWKKPYELAYETDEKRDLTADERNAKWAVEKLKELAGKKDGKPFFMGVGFIRPHLPLIVPKKYFDRFPLESIQMPAIKDHDVDDTFKDTVTSKEGDRRDDHGSKMFDSLVASYGGNREVALKHFIQAYLACVASVDDLIGDILDTLDRSPLRDNTIIVLTSDHGWQMGQKDYLYKNALWQESTRIPLVIRAPGVSTAGGKADPPVSLIDIYPTLIDLCGLPANTMKNEKGHPLDGHSLKPLLIDPVHGKWDGPDAVLSALYKWASYYDPGIQSYSLRTKDWRFIRYENGKEELYHVTEDPHEWTNLALDSKHDEPLKSLRAQLLARIPKSKPQSEEQSAELWKDKYFKKHPDADTNKDGTLSWPEFQAHRLKTGNTKNDDGNKATDARRLQTSGVFSRAADKAIVFTDSTGGGTYFVLNTLHEMAAAHLGATVKVVANVKPAKTGKAQLMVHIVSIRPAK